ncbi:MAG: DUF134 domain-containing protein [Dehalococcoidia bacterium]|nr:DUF134 domain-containing protein [Dehalococcoidia bacterium]
MGRPQLYRRVNSVPQVTYFKPVGVPLVNLQEIQLFIEEAEALNLKDLEGLEQEECAKRMNISRTTFSRILDSARSKVADALLNGKSLRINGGNYEMATRRFRCIRGHEWDVPFETMVSAPPDLCPECYTPSIMPLFPAGMGRGRHGRNRHGMNIRRL